MPHCIIEYSKPIEQEVDVNKLIASVHQGAINSELFEEENIKTRAISYDYYQTGSEKKPFIHVTCKILSGRSEYDRAMLSDLVLSELKQFPLSPISLTVDIVDIQHATYAKYVG